MRTRLLLCAVLLTAGCAPRVKNVTSLPAGVTQQQAQAWDAAVANLNKIAATTSTLRQAVVAVRNAGAFPDNGAYSGTLYALGKIDAAQLSASAILKQSPQNFSASAKQQVAAYVQQISAQLTVLNAGGVTGIKDANSLQQINGFIAEIAAAVQLILAL